MSDKKQSIEEQILILEKNISDINCPSLLFEMNIKYRKLKEELEIKNK
jgi:hypothetical protein